MWWRRNKKWSRRKKEKNVWETVAVTWDREVDLGIVDSGGVNAGGMAEWCGAVERWDSVAVKRRDGGAVERWGSGAVWRWSGGAVAGRRGKSRWYRKSIVFNVRRGTDNGARVVQASRGAIAIVIFNSAFAQASKYYLPHTESLNNLFYAKITHARTRKLRLKACEMPIKPGFLMV